MNGLANGEGTLYVKNEYTYTGEWKDNAKTGRGCEQYHITGDVYEGEFVNNEKEGKGKYTYKDGTVYEGGFANSRYDGRGKMTWTDGRKYIGEFRKGRIEGKGNAPLNEDGTFVRTFVKCRQDADYPVVAPGEVNLIDVFPQQIASVSAGLIPFLEHDDGHRALMGCNMMRHREPYAQKER